MKILHILDHSLPLHSGYTFRSQNIFRAQANREWTPVILTSPKHEESWKGLRTETERIGGFTYYRTGGTNPGKIPFEKEIRQMRATYKRILEVISIEKPDILHAHSPVLNAIPALYAGRKTGIPVVYEIRAFWEDAAVDHGTYRENSMKYLTVKHMETFVCKRVDHIGILCEGLKKDLAGRGIPPEKITIVYNGINPDDFTPCPPDPDYLQKWKLSGKTVIGFIGSFYRYEGLDLLIDAFSKLAETHPDILLLLVGGGEMERELREKIRDHGLEKKTVMPGRIPHEKIPGVYALVDILVYPRYSMRLTELVTPLKPLEAMAMEKTLVASDVGGHRELIHHDETGLLFPSGNADALCREIRRIIDDPDLGNRLKTKALKWVRTHHTWEKTTSVYDKMYESAGKCFKM